MTDRDDSGPDDERDAELAVARVRDVLGWPNDHLEPGERVLARVLNRIEDADRPAPVRRPARLAGPRGAERRRWQAVLAAAAAAVAVVVVQGVGPSTPAMASPPHLTYSLADPQDAADAPSAHDALIELADAALSAPVPGRGEVMYISSYGWYQWQRANTSTIAPISLRWWLAPDGSGMTEQRTGALVRPDGTVDPDPGIERAELAGDTFAPGEIPTGHPDTLPLEPAALRDALLAYLSPEIELDAGQRAADLIAQINTLADAYVLDERTAAALWNMLAQEEAVVTLGEARDRIGRRVVALAAPVQDPGSGPTVTVLLADLSTGRPVGNEVVTLSSEALAVTEPTVTGFTTITESRYVGDVGARS